MFNVQFVVYPGGMMLHRFSFDKIIYLSLNMKASMSDSLSGYFSRLFMVGGQSMVD